MATRDLFEYSTPAGASQSYLHFRGVAPIGTATSANAWRIERYLYGQAPDGTWKITDRQVMDSVPWDNRAALSWGA